MGELAGETRFRPWRLLGLVALGAAVVWVLAPHPLIRGIALGFALAPIAFVGVGALFVRRMRRRMGTGGPGSDLRPPPIPVDEWDYALAGTAMDGRPVDFAIFRDRVLVLNLWSTTCGPCVWEMPSLDRLARALADTDIEVACVSREPMETVRSFAEKRSLDLPLYVVDEWPDAIRPRGVPTTLVVDRTGRIPFRHVGAAAWDDPGVIDYLRGLAAAPSR